MLKNKEFSYFKLSNYLIYTLLINVKLPAIVGNCWHFNIYQLDKFQSQLSCAWKKFLQPRGQAKMKKIAKKDDINA